MSFLFFTPFDDRVGTHRLHPTLPSLIFSRVSHLTNVPTQDRSTSENTILGQEDMSLFLEITDNVKSGETKPKSATASFKRRLLHKNPNVQLITLKVSFFGFDVSD